MVDKTDSATTQGLRSHMLISRTSCEISERAACVNHFALQDFPTLVWPFLKNNLINLRMKNFNQNSGRWFSSVGFKCAPLSDTAVELKRLGLFTTHVNVQNKMFTPLRSSLTVFQWNLFSSGSELLCFEWKCLTSSATFPYNMCSLSESLS